MRQLLHRTRFSLVVLSAVSLALVGLLSLPASTADAAFTAGLVCEPDFGGAFCEASPVNATYSYDWSVSGGLFLPSACNSGSGSIVCHVGCVNRFSSGTVTVTVSKPNGASDSASRNVSC